MHVILCLIYEDLGKGYTRFFALLRSIKTSADSFEWNVLNLLYKFIVLKETLEK